MDSNFMKIKIEKILENYNEDKHFINKVLKLFNIYINKQIN